ncbi:MAG: hypothetical protein L6461_02985 [Anaerolineae bacterium]|nr:hypothetical protein [Anaerolineae bacterium]
MNAQSDVEKNLSPASGKGKHPPLVRIVALSVLGLVVICLVLWMLVFKESGLFAGPLPNLTATALAANDLACKKLVEQAMSETDKFCKDIGTNQLCYGNFSIDAELADGASEKFSQRGDVIDVDLLRRLSAAPLDLVKQAWGIAVFKVTANLPRSLPGQTITLLVFGNTTLNKDEPGLQTFYFFSDTGQVVCDAVPFDGLLISMPDGVGARFNINGSELVLTGTASITANLGGEMNISLYDGSAQVTADGETQVFGPGEQVSIPLGGETGLDPTGPPSEPIPLSEEDLALACTMTGENCDLTPIPTLSMTDLAATIESELGNGTAAPAETLPASTTGPANTAIALASPTSFPTATLAPPRTATRAPTLTPRPNPTNTRTPSRTPTRIATFTPTVTRTFTPTSIATFTPTNTGTFTPTNTGTFTPTFTATFTPVDTATFTPTFTTTFTPTNTDTFTPTFTPTFTLTNTPTHTQTLTRTNTPANTPAINCSLITLGNLSFSGNLLTMVINNGSTSDIRLTFLSADWQDVPIETQGIKAIKLVNQDIWEPTVLEPGTEPISQHSFTGAGGQRQVGNGASETLQLTFEANLAPGRYSLQVTFDVGCQTSQSGTRP